MGTNYRRSRNNTIKHSNGKKKGVVLTMITNFIKDKRGDIVVEATILFPIMIMIFAALVLLAIYLPQRAILQEAAQVAAIAIATERSDTWIAYDENAKYNRPVSLSNVYVEAVRNMFFSKSTDSIKVENIVRNYSDRGFLSVKDNINVEYRVLNYVIYQEVVVTVTQSIPMPVNLSFIGFPSNIVMTQEARAVVQNGDEFVRNVDMAKDMVVWLDNKLGISEGLKGALEKVGDSAIRSIFGH